MSRNKLIAGIFAGTALIWGGVQAAGTGVTIPNEMAVGDKTVALAWADNNDGEDLIIKSDKHSYSGSGEATVFFSITNTSKTDQTVKIKIDTPNMSWHVKDIKRIIGKEIIPEQVIDSPEVLTGSSTPAVRKVIPSNTVPIYQAKMSTAITYDARPKDVKGFINTQVDDFIVAGDTGYFQATIDYKDDTVAKQKWNLLDMTPRNIGEFFIEAFGSNGSYGQLDPSALLTNLLSFYKLDGNSNDTVSSINGADTSMTYNASYGLLNQGAWFKRKADSSTISIVDLASQSSLTPTVSISFWAKIISTSGGSWWYSSGNQSHLWRLGVNTTVGAGIIISVDNVGDTSLGGTLTSGNWYHVVITNTPGANGANAYLNGTLVGTATGISLTTPSGGAQFNTPNYGVDQNWYVDEIGIWTRVLSQAEVTTLYNGGTPLAYPFSTAATSVLPQEIIDFN